jgi:NAD(P)-dependent dehydrogenase (short-subunit alcohol dehydrogenase family)
LSIRGHLAWLHLLKVAANAASGCPLAFERTRIRSVMGMTKTSRSKTWIITGATSGLGLALTTAAIASGDRVLGTARRSERLDGLVREFGESFVPVRHDVRDVDGAAATVERAIDAFGGVDVLVNNAGGGLVGAAEEVTDDELRDMLAQHLFGPAAYVRAALPHMRAAGHGAIVQMSSQGGRRTFPAVGSYSAGKFALEGWSEALAGEVAPFGIRVLIVEPSRFRTRFNQQDVLLDARRNPEYDGVIGTVRMDMSSADGLQEGDPVRAAAAIRLALESPDAPLRLPLGAAAVHNIAAAYQRSLDELRAWTALSESADFPAAVSATRAL